MKKNLQKRKNILIKTVASLLLMTAFMVVMVLPVQASTAVNIPDDIKMSGYAKYLASADNYYIDLENQDMFKRGFEILNEITNSLFNDICFTGEVTTLLFYYCIKFDLSDLFANQINDIQSSLNNGVFQPLFYLGFCGVAFVIIKNLIRRNVIGIIGQIGKIIGIWVLSMLLVGHSSTVLSYATGITKSISTQILISMQGNDNVASIDQFAVQSAGAIWVNMVHQPWLFVEFGRDVPDEDMVELLLDDAYNPISNPEGRADLIEDYSGTAFKKNRIGQKMGFLFLYMVPMKIKSVIYIVLAVLTLGYQLFAVFYVLLAPVILILVMFPGYESMMGAWLRKFVETQVGILIMSFVLGLIVMIDNMLFDSCREEWGWFTVIIVQTVIALLVIVKRNELLGAISKMQRAVSMPRYAMTMLRNQNTTGALKMRNIVAAGAVVRTMKNTKKAGQIVGAADYNGEQKNTEDKKEAERPVMSPVKEQKSNKGAKVHTTNASVNASEPQKRISRPRMDKQPKKSVDGRLERAKKDTNTSISLSKSQKQVPKPRMNSKASASIELVERHPKHPERRLKHTEGHPVYSEQHQESQEQKPKPERPMAEHNVKATQETQQHEKESTVRSQVTGSISENGKAERVAASGVKKAGIGRKVDGSIPGERIETKAQDERVAKNTSILRPQSSAVPKE